MLSDASSQANTGTPTGTLTPMQLRRVDEAFEELFGYKWGTTPTFCFELNADMTQQEPTAAASTAHKQRQRLLLCEMLGPTKAARILLRNQSRNSSVRTTVANSNVTLTSTHADATGIAMAVATLSSGRTSTGTATKAVAYKKQHSYKVALASAAPAGSMICGNASIAKAPPAASDGGAAAAALEKKAITAVPAPAKPAIHTTGIDSLLNQLNSDPNKISTVAKTAMDWDQFKDQTGLGEKLEEQADSSTAYLKKQDFLTRVDHRTFELEKKERDRSRAKRG